MENQVKSTENIVGHVSSLNNIIGLFKKSTGQDSKAESQLEKLSSLEYDTLNIKQGARRSCKRVEIKCNVQLHNLRDLKRLIRATNVFIADQVDFYVFNNEYLTDEDKPLCDYGITANALIQREVVSGASESYYGQSVTFVAKNHQSGREVSGEFTALTLRCVDGDLCQCIASQD